MKEDNLNDSKKYSEIKSGQQYQKYCSRHLELGNILSSGRGCEDMESEYYILDLIIEDYHRKRRNSVDTPKSSDLLRGLMSGDRVSLPTSEEMLGAAEDWVFETNGEKWSNNDDSAGDNLGSFMAGVKWMLSRM